MSSPASSVDVPVSPTTAIPPPKRKPNRRANTAERRATHNAVERQRRETLNGRFLDLAALLPNLATVRRPSKSAIVNSSIAIVHAHRRRIALSARALRTLKAESDALRRELNEWRARSNLPRVEEPPRADELDNLMTLEDASWENAAAEERRAYEMAAAAAAQGDDDGDDGFYPQPVVQSPIASDAEKAAAWNAQLYSAMAAQQQQQHAQQHVQQVQVPSQPQIPTPPPMYAQVPPQYIYSQPPQAPRHALFGVEDDASSVGSSEHSGGYELAPGGYATLEHPRRLSLSIPSPPAWHPQQPQPTMSVPVSAGGGSSFHPMAWMM
jgi:hypothetical protein